MTDQLNPVMLARMERVVALIRQRVAAGDPVSLDELAGAAALSRFHFHRVYRLVTGEGPGETVRRLRLAHAVSRLEQDTVTGAAMGAGFASSQALAKALRLLLAASASELKSDQDRLDAAFITLSEPLPPLPGVDAPPLAIEVVRTPTFDVIMSRHVGDEAGLNGVYGALFEAVGGPEAVRAILGFPWSDQAHEPAEDQIFDAALLLVPQAEVLDRKPVGEGLFLRAAITGSYDQVSAVLDALALAVLSSREITFADRPAMIHYRDDPEETPEELLKADIYLPVALGS